MRFNTLILLLFLASCSGSRHAPQVAPEVTENPPAVEPTAPTPVVEPPVEGEVDPNAYDLSKGPEVESIELDLRKFAGSASQIHLDVIFEAENYGTRSLFISPKFQPSIKLYCLSIEADQATSAILAPVKTLRLAARANVSFCDRVTIQIPKNPAGYYFDPASVKFSWFLEVDQNQKIKRYWNQMDSGDPIVADGKESALSSVIMSRSTLPLYDRQLVLATTHYELVAFLELVNYKSGTLQLSSAFWPRLLIECDGRILDETTSFALAADKLRLVVKADVTGCEKFSILPSHQEGKDGSHDPASALIWNLTRVER